MAIMTNTANTYGMIGIREDLTDIVAMISPQDTPFISNIGTGPSSTQTKHEWQTQTLTAPSKSNFVLEGDDAPAALTINNRTRLFNYCAISRKVGAVSGTGSAVIVAGVSDELDNQKMLRAVELRRDMEVILLNYTGYAAGGTATVRQCAGLGAYITNADMTGAANYTVATGDGSDSWNLGATTARALTLTLLNATLLLAHQDGGKPDMLMMSPTNKVNFSNLTLQSSLGGATQIRYNLNGVRPGALIGAVDTWLSNFGSLDVMSNVQMGYDSGTTNGEDDTAYLIDSQHAAISYLRPMQSQDLSKTGDNTKFMILAEYTLQVDAPTAHAAIFGLA